MRLTRKQLLLVLLSVVGTSLAALIYARRAHQPVQVPAPRAAPSQQASAGNAYVDPAICASCHQEIARTYSLTGMARSFSRVSGSQFTEPIRVHHKPSDRYYTSAARDGRFYQRRHQIGFDGKEANALEFEAHYVIGSGNHARTFLHRKADGRLLQLPVSWYAERGGSWAMSPGYDKPAHQDFRRVIDAGCMSCHNGYPPSLAGAPASFRLRADGATAGQAGVTSPPAPFEDDRAGPRFGTLPEGIDCQRCHGPGQAHVDAINARDLEAGRRAIVNPANLDRDRQLETCMQCHLESTSSPLPFQIRRYEHPPFSYAPGKRLSDYFIHFDHAPGTPRLDDKFEIAGGAYRLRKSACFQRSEMTCTTCHDPHDVPRGAKAVERYVAVCQSCHEAPHRGGVPQLSGVSAKATCLDCHMPKRRTEDAVHVIMTDHYIQRERPRGDLLAERTEAEGLEHRDYRGEVALYYPPTLPATPENELYVALAQVKQGSNLAVGIRRLEDAIEKHRPQRPEFFYELGRAYSMSANYDVGIRWCREALRRDPNFVPALKELATAAMTSGRLAEAEEALKKAVALRPEDGNAFADLGNVYLRQGRVDAAQNALQRALVLDPAMPLANNMMGLAALRQGHAEAAEKHLREAIRHQPDLAEAHNNLGNVLAAGHSYAEAGYHFEQAIRSDAAYVEARHSRGVVLALMGRHAEAIAALKTAIALAPDRAQARVDLADVLATVGRVNEAAREYAIAAKAADPDARAAAQAALQELGR